MNAFDPVRLRELLDPDGRGGRRSVEEVARAVRQLAPYIDPAALPELVREILRLGKDQGHWSVTRISTRHGATVLPKGIVLPKPARPAAVAVVDTPLRPELASWAASLMLTASQRRLLLAVNDWLRRTGGGNVPMAAAAERAYELIGDEKAFDSTPPRGGATMWGPGRLTFELLRCERVPTPLTWEPAVAVVGEAGPVVCVENHATFRSILRVLRSQGEPQWVAVAWIQGRNTAPLGGIEQLPFTATRMDYLGDLDPVGLEIAAAACEVVRGRGIQAGPADHLWDLLIAQPARDGPRTSADVARKLGRWLPERFHGQVVELFTDGRRIPQEALRFELLAAALT